MPITRSKINKIAEFTADLIRAAGTYDLCTASGDVHINLADIAVYVRIAGATITSVSIQTNQTNPTIILSAAEGAVANLLVEKNLTRAIAGCQSITLRSGQKLQYTIIGLTGSGELKVVIPFLAITPAANLGQ